MACPDSFAALRRAFDLDDLNCKLTRLLSSSLTPRTNMDSTIQAIAVGYSNGANIAASLLLTHSRLLPGAVLFRPMVPSGPNPVPNLKGRTRPAGRRQAMTRFPPQQTAELSRILTTAGPVSTTHWHPGGHELGADDVAAAKEWLSA